MDSLELLWQRISGDVRSSVTEQTYATWFEPIRPISITDFNITIEVPSKFYYEWINSHYKNIILASIKKETGKDFQLNFNIAGKNNGEVSLQKKPINGVSPSGKPKDYDRSSKLNSRYVFNTFVGGPNNQFARAAALSVANSPGQTSFNPLLIYGGVGLGKTHLMQAIGNNVLSEQINAKVPYKFPKTYL